MSLKIIKAAGNSIKRSLPLYIDGVKIEVFFGENGLAGVNRVDGGGGMYDRRSMADAQQLDVGPAAANRQLSKTLDKRGRKTLSDTGSPGRYRSPQCADQTEPAIGSLH